MEYRGNKHFNLYLSAFFIPMLLFFVLLSFFKIVPFGNNTLLTGDMKNQYIALFSYLKANGFNLNALLYSNSVTLGGNFYGVTTYYLLNPLNLIFLLFPLINFPLAVSIITTIKISLIGLTMSVFLTNSNLFKTKPQKKYKIFLLMISTAFALMQFVIMNKECIMWLDSIIMLPIVCLGVEKILQGKKPILFVFSLVLTIFLNYYMGYMIGLFSGIYFICLLIRNKLFTQDSKQLPVKIITYFLSALLVIGMSMMVLLPSYLSISEVTQSHIFHFSKLFDLVNFIGQLFGKAPVGNLPSVFVGIPVLCLVIICFISNKVNLADKIFFGMLILILFSSMWIDFFYLVWHMFAWPNGYSQRASFLFSYVLCLAAYFVLENIKFNKIDALISGLILILLLGLIRFKSMISTKYFVMSFIFVFVSVILLVLVKNYRNKLLPIAMLFFVSTTSIMLIDARDLKTKTISSSNYTSFQKYVKQTSSVVNAIKKNDKTTFRIGNAVQLNENEPLLFNYLGISNYLSQQSNQLTDFMSSVGFYQKHSWFRWMNFNNGSVLSVNRIFGIKYIYGNNNSKFQKYLNDYKSTDIQKGSLPQNILGNILPKKNLGSFYIYKDAKALPVVYKINDKNKIHLKYEPGKNEFNSINQFWKAISGSNDKLLINQQVKKLNSHIFVVNPTISGRAYLYIPINRENIPHQMKLIVNGRKQITVFKNESENGVVYLGTYKKNAPITINIEKNSKNQNKLFVSSENENVFNDFREKFVIRDRIEHIHVKNDHISFRTAKSFSGGKVMISVPYDKSWQVTIDGKKNKVNRTLKELTAVNVSEGQHTVKMNYKVPGLKVGIWLSILSLGIFIIFEIFYSKKNKVR